jgi:hypothetical protein
MNGTGRRKQKNKTAEQPSKRKSRSLSKEA